jgi:hypothetical protein
MPISKDVHQDDEMTHMANYAVILATRWNVVENSE